VSFNLVTFKPLDVDAIAEPFVRALLDAGDIYVPERYEAPRRRQPRFEPEKLKPWSQFWSGDSMNRVFLGRRRRQAEMTVVFGIAGKTPTPLPSNLSIYVDASYYDPPGRILSFVGLGTKFYDLLSPYYAHLQIPHMPIVGPTGIPDLGFPGFGWATWLGPEYEPLIQIPPADTVSIVELADGGRLVTLCLPERISLPDVRCLQGHHHVMSHAAEDILQPRVRSPQDLLHWFQRHDGSDGPKRLPKYRFVAEGPHLRLSTDRHDATHERYFGPLGFTRKPEIRAILDRLESRTIPGTPGHGSDGTSRFEGLAAQGARELLAHVTLENANFRLENTGPTLRELVALGERYPSILFFGYRVAPERPDERIVLEGFYIPKEEVKPGDIRSLNELMPDELGWVSRRRRKWLRVWWD
jgi:hypothetical protein